MDKGKLTWWVLAIGLTVVGLLMLLPGMGMYAIWAAIATPIFATFATSTELFLRGHKLEGASLICAVALVILVAIWSSK